MAASGCRWLQMADGASGCKCLQVLAANLKKSEIYKITFFSRWHTAATWRPLGGHLAATWRPLAATCSHLQPLATTWQPLAAATGAGVCQVAAKWLQVAAPSKWLQVAAPSKWLQVAAFLKIKMMHVCSLSG